MNVDYCCPGRHDHAISFYSERELMAPFSFPRVWQAIIFVDVMRHRSLFDWHIPLSNAHSIDLLILRCQMGVDFALIQSYGRLIENNNTVRGRWKDCHESNHRWWFFFILTFLLRYLIIYVCVYLSQWVCGTCIDAHLHTAWINHSNSKCFLLSNLARSKRQQHTIHKIFH